MLYEINFDNTKNIKSNENIFNCSIKIVIGTGRANSLLLNDFPRKKNSNGDRARKGGA